MLFGYATEQGSSWQNNCLDWIRGRVIDRTRASRLNLPREDWVEPEASSHAINALCRDRLSGLCQLAGFHVPPAGIQILVDQIAHGYLAAVFVRFAPVQID